MLSIIANQMESVGMDTETRDQMERIFRRLDSSTGQATSSSRKLDIKNIRIKLGSYIKYGHRNPEGYDKFRTLFTKLLTSSPSSTTQTNFIRNIVTFQEKCSDFDNELYALSNDEPDIIKVSVPLLGFACKYWPVPLDIMKMILDAAPEAILTLSYRRGRFPLSNLVRRYDRTTENDMFITAQYLLDADYEQYSLVTYDRECSTPLMWSLRPDKSVESLRMAQFLVNADISRRSLLMSDKCGHVPLWEVARILQSSSHGNRINSSDEHHLFLIYFLEQTYMLLADEKIIHQSSSNTKISIFHAFFRCAHLLGEHALYTLKLLLKYDKQNQLNDDDEDDNLPLHIAASFSITKTLCFNDNIDVSGINYERASEETLASKFVLNDERIFSEHFEIIKCVCEAYPDAARELNQQGELPLHRALKNQKRFFGWEKYELVHSKASCWRPRHVLGSAIDYILNAYPLACEVADKETGMFPFLLAATCGQTLSCVYTLLRRVPHLVAPSASSLTSSVIPTSEHAMEIEINSDDGLACKNMFREPDIQTIRMKLGSYIKDGHQIPGCYDKFRLLFTKLLTLSPQSTTPKNFIKDIAVHPAYQHESDDEFSDDSSDEESDDVLPLLHLACIHYPVPLDIIRMIIDASPEAVVTLSNMYGSVPLSELVYRHGDRVDENLKTIARLLLNADHEKHSLVIRDNQGMTPLLWSLCRRSSINRFSMAKFLVDADETRKSLLIKDSKGHVPLWYAASLVQKSVTIDGNYNYNDEPDPSLIFLLEQTYLALTDGKPIYQQSSLPDGRISIFHAFLKCMHLFGRNAPHALRHILTHDKHNQLTDQDEDGNLPLHIVTSYSVIERVCFNDDIISDVLSDWKGGVEDSSASTINDERRFSEHLGIIKWVCEAYPDAARKSNKRGELPLHRALKNQKRIEGWELYEADRPDFCDFGRQMVSESGYPLWIEGNGIEYILNSYPAACRTIDMETGLFPFMLAASCGQTLSCIYSLLREVPELVTPMIVSGNASNSNGQPLNAATSSPTPLMSHDPDSTIPVVGPQDVYMYLNHPGDATSDDDLPSAYVDGYTRSTASSSSDLDAITCESSAENSGESEMSDCGD